MNITIFVYARAYACSQRRLAEVTEMIRTSNLVHKGLVNIYPSDASTESIKDKNYGNKIALLGGDYLIGLCCSELANLRNSEVRNIKTSSNGIII